MKPHVARLYSSWGKVKQKRCCHVSQEGDVEQRKIKSSHLDEMCAKILPLSEWRKAHVLQQPWPFHSDITSRVPRTGTRTGTGWEDSSLMPSRYEQKGPQSRACPHLLLREHWPLPSLRLFARGYSAALLPSSSTHNLVAWACWYLFFFQAGSIISLTRISHISVNTIQHVKASVSTVYWRVKENSFY